MTSEKVFTTASNDLAHTIASKYHYLVRLGFRAHQSQATPHISTEDTGAPLANSCTVAAREAVSFGCISFVGSVLGLVQLQQ